MSLPREKGRLAKLLLKFNIIKVDHVGFRKNTRIYICEHKKTKARVAVIKKRPNSRFRDGMSYEEAFKKEAVCWSLDDLYINTLESVHQIAFMIFYEEGTEDTYLCRIEDWTDPDKRYQRQNVFESTFRAQHELRYVSIKHMKFIPGNPSLFRS